MREKEITEGLGELADIAERDHEVQMARADLYKSAKYAIKLHDMLKGVSEAEGLEGWVQSKITKAADMLGSVYHHMDYEESGLADEAVVVGEAKDTHCSDKCCGSDVKAEDCTCPPTCKHCNCNATNESTNEGPFKGAGIGAGIGALAGPAISAAAGGNPAVGKLAQAALGAGLGAIPGAFVGALNKREKENKRWREKEAKRRREKKAKLAKAKKESYKDTLHAKLEGKTTNKLPLVETTDFLAMPDHLVDVYLEGLTIEQLEILEEGVLGAIGRGIKGGAKLAAKGAVGGAKLAAKGAAGGAKLAAKGAVGGAKLAAKGAKGAVVNKQGNVRLSTAGRADGAEAKLAKIQAKKTAKIDKAAKLKKDQERLAKAKASLATANEGKGKFKSAAHRKAVHAGKASGKR